MSPTQIFSSLEKKSARFLDNSVFKLMKMVLTLKKDTSLNPLSKPNPTFQKSINENFDTTFVNTSIAQFPHCDQKVLHRPGSCKYCDLHPDWQALRMAWEINFTDYKQDSNLLPDPAQVSRDIHTINKWGGNFRSPKIPDPPHDRGTGVFGKKA